MGFAASKSNSSLFIRKGLNVPVYILPYVDDLVITGPRLDEIGRVKSQLSDLGDLGDLYYFLGIEVIRTPRWHVAVTKTVCVEYVVQVRHEGMSTDLHTPRPEPEALSRLRPSLR